MLYIALLRGINVGGHTVKMDHLRTLFAQLGFARVRTYIQSGNVFFETEETDRQALTQTIERHLREALGFDVPVFLRTDAELAHIVASDPFKHIPLTPDLRFSVTFTSEPISRSLALPLSSPKGDMDIIHTTDYEAFVVWHIVNGRPPASDAFLAKAIGARTTTRFFHTTAKILEAARNG